MSKASYFTHFFRYRARGVGNTHTLIQGMLQSPNSVMFVTSQHHAHILSRQYGIPEHRFISVANGLRNLEGRQFNAPIVVDLPAIADILNQVEIQHIEEINKLNEELSSKNLSIMNLEWGTVYLNARVRDRDKEIVELKAENQRLQNVIANATNTLNDGVQQTDERFLRKNV